MMWREFCEGRDAYEAGLSLEDCPYVAEDETLERLEWEEGWHAGVILVAIEKGETM